MAGPGASGRVDQHPETVVEGGEKLFDAQHVNLRRGQLDGEGQPVETAHNFCHRSHRGVLRLETVVHRSGPIHEQPDGVALSRVGGSGVGDRHRPEAVAGLTWHLQGLPARDQHPHVLPRPEQPFAQLRRAVEHMLAVVEHQEDVPFTGVVGTFTDVDTNQVASAFTAWVDWGDGGGTAATADITPVTVVSAGIQNDCGQPCDVFNLIGTHTYTRGGGYALTAYFSKVGDPSIQDIPISGFAAVVSADGDLSVSTPPNISTDATSPAGAPVAYVPPQVSDPDDPTVATASCSPAPGSTFAIGTTTVNCSATDTDDLPSAVSSSFTVTVIGPAEQVTALSQTVQSVGTGGSLVATLAGVQSKLAAGQTVAACNMLNAFTHQVSAQSGKSISPSQADSLISEAIQIRAVLSC